MDQPVGSDDCKFFEVAMVLSSSIPEQKHFFTVARKLGVPDDVVEKCKFDLRDGKIPLSEVYYEILKSWRQRRALEAKLGDLISVVEDCRFPLAADKLREKFNIEQSCDESPAKIPRLQKYSTISSDLALSIKAMKRILIVFTQDAEITVEKIQNTTSIKYYDEDRYIDFDDTNSGINLCNPPLTNMKKIITLRNGKFIFVTTLKITEIRNEIPMSEMIEFAVDKTEWKQLSRTYQKEILTRSCMFEDKEISLIDFCNMITNETVNMESILDKYVYGDLLIDLIHDRKPHIFKSTIPKTIEYYIPRRIVPRSKVSNKIFQMKSNDIFVFTGISISKLASMATSGITGNSSEQCASENISAQFIVLDSTTDFECVCEKSSKVVHWLNYRNEHLHWVKSRGSLVSIQEHLDNSSPQEFGEEDFINYLQKSNIINKSSRPVCVSDAPGMGKSVLVSFLGRELVKSGNKLCFYFVMSEIIDLVDKNDAISEQDKAASLSKVLSKIISKSSLATNLFSNLTKHGNVNLELIFDGLDEVQVDDLPLAYSCLKIIANHEMFQNCRLWVATRPQLLDELEDNLQVLGHNIEPFDLEDQKKCLKEFWGQDPNLDKEKLGQYADKCVEALKSQMDDKARYIAGIPLQCQLLAEVYADAARRYCRGRNNLPVVSVSSISDLYQKLIKRKFKTYRSRFKNGEILNEEQLLKDHIYLSFKLLFPKQIKQLNIYNSSATFEEILNVGILESSSSLDVPRFIHRTFAEFFVALYVEECLRQNAMRKDITFVLKTIFSTENLKLPICKYVKFSMASRRFKHKVICYFVNSLILQDNQYKILHLNLSNVLTSNIRNAVFASASEDVSNIFNYLLNTILFNDVDKRQIFNESLLFVATKLSSLEIVKEIFTIFKSQNNNQQISEINESGVSLLHAAVERGYFLLVDYLIKYEGFRDLLKHTSDQLRGIVHFCVQNTTENSKQTTQDKLNILDYILCINSAFLKVKFNEVTPVLCEKIHPELLLRSIKDSNCDLSETDKSGNTIAHKAAQYLSSENYNIILNQIPDTCEMFNAFNDKRQTPLQMVVQHMEPSEKIVTRFKEKSVDFNSKDKQNNTILMTAIKHGRSPSCLQLLIDAGSSCFHVNRLGSTLLHFAAKHANAAAIHVLLEKGLSIEEHNQEKKSPLHYLFEGGHVDCIESLWKLENGKICNSHHESLSLAVKSVNFKVVRKLLELGEFENDFEQDSVSILLDELFKIYLDKRENEREMVETAKALIQFKTDVQADINSISKILCEIDTSCLLETDFLKILLLDKGLKISQQTATTLIFQIVKCRHGDYKTCHILDQLLQFGGNFNYLDDHNNTLLHVASTASCIECVNYLVGKGISVNQLNSQMDTPLHVYSPYFRGSVEVFDCLIEHGADLNAVNKNKQTPFHAAIEKNNLEIIKHILASSQFIPEIHGSAEQVLCLACIHADGDTLQYLCEEVSSRWKIQLKTTEFNCCENQPTLFHHAVANYFDNKMEFVKYLVESGGFREFLCNSQTNNLLHLMTNKSQSTRFSHDNRACIQYIADVQKELLNTLDASGKTPLLMSNIDINILQLLIQLGCDVEAKDSDGNTVLHLAPTYLNSAEYHELLESLQTHNKLSELVSARSKSQITPLHTASFHLNLQESTIQLFDTCHADFNAVDSDGNSVLMHAVRGNRSIYSIQLLLQYNSDIKTCNNNASSVLHWASYNGNAEAVRYFISLRSEPNCVDKEGNTPLHCSLIQENGNNMEIVKLLVENGAHLNTVNSYLSTPIFSALSLQNVKDGCGDVVEIIKYLIEKGGNIYQLNAEANTIMHLAPNHLSPENYHKFVEFSCNNGFNDIFKMKNCYNRSPLHVAAEKLEIMESTLEIFKSIQVDFNAIDLNGCSVLFGATAGNRSSDMLRNLIMKYGCDWKVVNNSQSTMLHAAAYFGNVEATELFIELGCEVSAKDIHHKTALDYALENQHEEIIKLLRENFK